MDTLIIGGRTFTGVTGIKATDDNSTVQTFTKGGGGGSEYTLLVSDEVTVNTTSTTLTTVKTITVPSVWTSAAIVYIQIRDKAGPRNGYFYGWDGYFINPNPSNDSTSNATNPLSNIYSYASTTFLRSTGHYGVCTSSTIPSDGTITIQSRYSSNNSRTIDGTFSIKIYLLKWPDNVSPFAR